ncbi:hypothetical protein ACWEF9_09595 [Streptomyces sp. NPDC004980]
MGRSDLWRIVLPQHAGWLSQITIGPDLLTAVVDGEALDGAVLELTWAAGNERRPSTVPAPTTSCCPTDSRTTAS